LLAARDVERFCADGGLQIAAEQFEDRFVRAAGQCAPEVFGAEPAPCARLVDDVERMAGAHLASMAANRGQLARNPARDVDRYGVRSRGITERIWRQTPESVARRQPPSPG